MKHKKILIIGAGSYSKKNPLIKGIGTCLVEKLSRKGFLDILFSYFKSKAGADKLVKEITNDIPMSRISNFSFNSLNYKKEWFVLKEKLSNLGTPDIFIYNAGLRFYKKKLTKKEIKQTTDVNYNCPLFLIEKISKKMIKENKKGKIIIVGSVLAGKHHEFLEEYCKSKGLVKDFVKNKKKILSEKNIVINIISPDVTITPMTEERIDYYKALVKKGKLKKTFSAEEVAESISRLLY